MLSVVCRWSCSILWSQANLQAACLLIALFIQRFIQATIILQMATIRNKIFTNQLELILYIRMCLCQRSVKNKTSGKNGFRFHNSLFVVQCSSAKTMIILIIRCIINLVVKIWNELLASALLELYLEWSHFLFCLSSITLTNSSKHSLMISSP